MIDLRLGDCLDVLKTLESNSVDSCVTDPPYGISFMNKNWDHSVPSKDVWREVLRVLKPGGHLLSFFGTRTYHRGVVEIEDAGFEIRDQIGWTFGSGFPKGADVSKMIDAAAGADRETLGVRGRSGSQRNCMSGDFSGGEYMETAPATDAARQWSGWNTSLKPAWEPIVVARKPLEGTVAANVIKWGTGAINVDGCRVGTEIITQHGRNASPNRSMSGANYAERAGREWTGRWPANIVHDGSDEVVELFGDAARFFYCAKASKKDRNAGLDGGSNTHATVKPLALMSWLCRLATPPGGVVLDPFMGSGSTGRAAISEGFNFIGIEREEEYFNIAKNRIK